VAEDRLHYHIRDGVGHLKKCRKRAGILDKIDEKKKTEKEKEKGVRKSTLMYMVNSQKFASEATAEELAKELSTADIGIEDTHRILQCKIRLVNIFPC
jgi:response regulator of citrate/malate metabolism